MQTPAQSVPRFALFGEDTGVAFEDLVHCETIAIRSKRYEWEIAPHRHTSLFQMLLVVDGNVDLTVAGLRSERSGPVLLVTPPGTIHGFRFAQGTKGFVLSLSERFTSALQAEPGLRKLAAKPDVLELDPPTAERLQALCEQVILANDSGTAADLVRRALAEAFVRIVAELDADTMGSREDDLVNRFRELVQGHLSARHNVRFFAARLHTTERTLSRRVRAALDVSPGQYLNERLAAEATRLLRFTNADCCQVADELGFADPSYFSRFYARMTGRRPSKVRSASA